jgi:hypothetical protein
LGTGATLWLQYMNISTVDLPHPAVSPSIFNDRFFCRLYRVLSSSISFGAQGMFKLQVTNIPPPRKTNLIRLWQATENCMSQSGSSPNRTYAFILQKCDGGRPLWSQCHLRPPRSKEPCRYPHLVGSPPPEESPAQMVQTINALRIRVEELEYLNPDPTHIYLNTPYSSRSQGSLLLSAGSRLG